MAFVCEAHRGRPGVPGHPRGRGAGDDPGHQHDGVQAPRLRLSAAFAGLAGTLYAYYVQLVSPSVASAATTSLVIGMVVFGGLGTIWGPALGALLLFGLYEGLRFVGVVYNLIAVGLVIMVFVIFFPRGLAGLGRSP